MMFHARRYILPCVSLLFLPFSKYFLAQALSFVFTVSDNCSPLQTKRMVSFVLGIVLDPYNESSPESEERSINFTASFSYYKKQSF